jgi:hypothetical protein
MPQFSKDESERLANELEPQIVEALHWSSYNQGWDIAFRVALLILGLATVMCSGIATSHLHPDPRPWSLTSTVLAGASALLSAFAFSDFRFVQRQRLWRRKADALSSLRVELLYANPEKTSFLDRLAIVRSWGDQTDPDSKWPGIA